MAWTKPMTDAYLAEMQRRWIDRIDNPKSVMDTPDHAVTRGEMRLWSEQQFGQLPPEMDLEWSVPVAKRFRLFVARESRKRGLPVRKPSPLDRDYERRYT